MDRVDFGFINLMYHFVPPTKRHEVDYIRNENTHTIEKTNQIRDKIIEYIDSDIPGIKFKNTKIFLKWYARQCASYANFKTNQSYSHSTTALQ